MAMGDYGWSMNFDTSQGVVAVETKKKANPPQKKPKEKQEIPQKKNWKQEIPHTKN